TNFTVVPPPTITSFSPTNGPVGAIVTITGTNFTGATAVKFNGLSTSHFTVLSATSISATVSAGATTGPITVTTLGGMVTSTDSFAVDPSPLTIGTFSPRNGPIGMTIVIAGSGFTGTTAVQFNGINASTFSVVSDTWITVAIPAGATTGPISVTTAAGTVP